MARTKKIQGFRPRRGGSGPVSWRSSVGKATQTWRNPRKPRSKRSKKGW